MNDFHIPDSDDEKSVLKTIRMKYSSLRRLEELSKKSNISVNRLINECIEYALKNMSAKDLKKYK